MRHALTFLLSRAYFCDMGSYQMMSPVEKPMMMSRWFGPLVIGLTSWHSACAFVNRIFVRCSSYRLSVWVASQPFRKSPW